MSNVVLGVAGGIAAYKACEVLRRLRASEHEVRVVPTEAALSFVGTTTWEALSGQPVFTDVWTEAEHVPHVAIGQRADLVVIAPATADLLARAAAGRADDLLTNVLLTASCPVLMCPAMHTEMWEHAATRASVATLRSRGVVVLDPARGRLTGADSGPGRLPEAAEIADVGALLLAEPALARAASRQDLQGRSVLVSAGGTREHLDPVRFLGNSSSGLMGIALARAARLRGAQVSLVLAHVEHPPPSGVDVVMVRSARELHEAMTRLAPEFDAVIMAAAVADYAPASVSPGKLSKQSTDGLALELVQTTDVLAGLVESRRPGQLIVGFAAETAEDETELLALGRAKLARKGCDLLVVNDVRGGALFGSQDTAVYVLDAAEPARPVSHHGSKAVVAQHIVSELETLWISAADRQDWGGSNPPSWTASARHAQ